MAANLEVLEEVGRGGTCVVHRGLLRGEHGTQRTVAVKRLLESCRDDPAAIDRFVHEAKLATRFDHPRLVHALELRKDDDGYLLLSEWVDGCTLEQLATPVPPALVATIGQALCDGLEYLHELPGGAVIHRDVTPGNVFLTRTGEVKLGDLGVALCASDPAHPKTRAITRGFGAPEQHEDAAVDGRADIYALGKTLQTLTDAPPLLDVLRRATREAKEERYATASEMRAALRGFHAPAPLTELARLVQARPESTRPVLDSAVRSILGGSQSALGPIPSSGARRSTVEPALPPRPSRTIGLLPWAVAALLASVAVYFSVPTRGPSIGKSDARSEEAPGSSPRLSIEAAPPAQAPKTERAKAADATGEPSEGGLREPTEATEPAKHPPPARKRARMVPITVTERPPPTPRATTTLTLGCTPWAEVTLDGKPLGNTPLRQVRVPVGKHALEMRHPPTGQSKTIELELEKDRAITVLVNLNTDEVKVR